MAGREPERHAGLSGQFGHAPGMAKAQRRLEVAEVGEGSQRPVKLIVGQCRAQLRIERDHLIPGGDAPEPVEDLAMAGTETINQLWIELGAPPLAGYLQRGLRAAGVVERLDEVGQVHQAYGGSQSIGAGRTRYPSAVPPFECLQQRLAHLRAELQPLSEITRCLAVRHHHMLHRVAGRGHELPDHPDPAKTRPAATEMTGDKGRQRDTPKILVARVGVHLGLVAEQRRHLTGLGGTAHPCQQRCVVRRRAGRLLHPGRRPQPHGDDRLAQDPLHRPSHSQVGDKRQGRHQLGESHSHRGVRSHQPILPLLAGRRR